MSARKQVVVQLRCVFKDCAGPHVFNHMHYRTKTLVGNWTPKEITEFYSKPENKQSSGPITFAALDDDITDFGARLHRERMAQIQLDSENAIRKHRENMARLENTNWRIGVVVLLVWILACLGMLFRN